MKYVDKLLRLFRLIAVKAPVTASRESDCPLRALSSFFRGESL